MIGRDARSLRARTPALRVYDRSLLTKWYLDCSNAAGHLAIAYWARLAWGKLAVAYSSVMINRGGATRTRESLFAGPAPVIDADRLTWRAPAIGIDVAMTRRAPAWAASLIDGVTWRCEFPSADAAIAIDGEPEIRGNGYAELLQLEVAPWELPIDELLWGHSESVTWIEWRGAHPLTLTLVDGVPAACERPRVESSRVIRDATLAESLKIPGLLLPKRIAAAREEKRIGHSDDGWVVYETVRFC